jgi:hypothetical protein
MEPQRVQDVAPDLAAELRALLTDAGERDLAVQVDRLMLVDRCRCGDDFCAMFYTAARPGGAWGVGLRTVALHPESGMINVDVVADKIVAVEVLYRDEVKAIIHAVLP